MANLSRYTIKDLELSVRTTNALQNWRSVLTLDAVDAMSDETLARIPRLGRKGLKEVREAISNARQWVDPVEPPTLRFTKLVPSARVGMDLCYCAAADVGHFTDPTGRKMHDGIPPGRFGVLETGLSVEVPEGYELQLRNVLATLGVAVLGGDASQVILANHSTSTFIAMDGDCIAQLVLTPITRARIE